MTNATPIASIDANNIADFAANSAYGGSSTWYRNAAFDLIRICDKRKVRTMISHKLIQLNVRRRSSHELHHHYETDLAALAALIEVAKTSGVI